MSCRTVLVQLAAYLRLRLRCFGSGGHRPIFPPSLTHFSGGALIPIAMALKRMSRFHSGPGSKIDI